MSWKAIGRVLVFPVTGPVRLAKKAAGKAAEKTSLKIIQTVVRQLLTLVGGTGFIASDDTVAQVASAVAVLISVGWSVINARREARKGQ